MQQKSLNDSSNFWWDTTASPNQEYIIVRSGSNEYPYNSERKEKIKIIEEQWTDEIQINLNLTTEFTNDSLNYKVNASEREKDKSSKSAGLFASKKMGRPK